VGARSGVVADHSGHVDFSHTATHCYTLHHTATHCNTLQQETAAKATDGAAAVEWYTWAPEVVSAQITGIIYIYIYIYIYKE